MDILFLSSHLNTGNHHIISNITMDSHRHSPSLCAWFSCPEVGQKHGTEAIIAVMWGMVTGSEPLVWFSYPHGFALPQDPWPRLGQWSRSNQPTSQPDQPTSQPATEESRLVGRYIRWTVNPPHQSFVMHRFRINSFDGWWPLHLVLLLIM